MLTRSLLAIAAAALAALASVIAGLDGDGDIVPFFVALTAAGGIGAWAVREPHLGGALMAPAAFSRALAAKPA